MIDASFTGSVRKVSFVGIWATIQPLIVNGLVAQMIVFLIGVVVMYAVDEKHLSKIFNKDGSRKSDT